MISWKFNGIWDGQLERSVSGSKMEIKIQDFVGLTEVQLDAFKNSLNNLHWKLKKNSPNNEIYIILSLS